LLVRLLPWLCSSCELDRGDCEDVVDMEKELVFLELDAWKKAVINSGEESPAFCYLSQNSLSLNDLCPTICTLLWWKIKHNNVIVCRDNVS
jgi:hypothetical protein